MPRDCAHLGRPLGYRLDCRVCHFGTDCWVYHLGTTQSGVPLSENFDAQCTSLGAYYGYTQGQCMGEGTWVKRVLVSYTCSEPLHSSPGLPLLLQGWC